MLCRASYRPPPPPPSFIKYSGMNARFYLCKIANMQGYMTLTRIFTSKRHDSTIVKLDVIVFIIMVRNVPKKSAYLIFFSGQNNNQFMLAIFVGELWWVFMIRFPYICKCQDIQGTFTCCDIEICGIKKECKIESLLICQRSILKEILFETIEIQV